MDIRHVWICLGNPKAYREVYALSVDSGGARSHLHAQALRQSESRLAAGLRQQQAKLVATKSSRRVRTSSDRSAHRCDDLKNVIAEVVAEAVIDNLEAVDINQQHGKRPAIALKVRLFGGANRIEMPSIVKSGQSIGVRQGLEIVGVPFRFPALPDCGRQPPMQEQAEHKAARGDIDELRHDEQIGIPQEFAYLAGKQTVLTAEIKTEVDVLDDVTDGVDADHGQQQPRSSECSRIARYKRPQSLRERRAKQ